MEVSNTVHGLNGSFLSRKIRDQMACGLLELEEGRFRGHKETIGSAKAVTNCFLTSTSLLTCIDIQLERGKQSSDASTPLALFYMAETEILTTFKSDEVV